MIELSRCYIERGWAPPVGRSLRRRAVRSGGHRVVLADAAVRAGLLLPAAVRLAVVAGRPLRDLRARLRHAEDPHAAPAVGLVPPGRWSRQSARVHSEAQESAQRRIHPDELL